MRILLRVNYAGLIHFTESGRNGRCRILWESGKKSITVTFNGGKVMKKTSAGL
jgi:hypothetical protein